MAMLKKVVMAVDIAADDGGGSRQTMRGIEIL